jgi:lipid II:glycine glycyltransferase (peptidoglycan interpeptide bridge formation enzyme)
MARLMSYFLNPTDIERYQADLVDLGNTCQAHFLQSLAWYQALHKFGLLRLFASFDGQALVAYSLVKTIKVPLLGEVHRIERGPVCKRSWLVPHLEELMRQLRPRGIWLEISPHYLNEEAEQVEQLLQSCGWQPKPFDNWLYRATVSIDLRQSEEAMKANLRRSLKTQLNKARRANIQVGPTTVDEDIDWFFHAHSAMMTRRNIPEVPRAWQEGIKTLLLAGQAGWHLLIAHHDGERVAGVLLAPAGGRMVYGWGFSSEQPEHRDLPLTHLLHWEAIQLARAAGYASYDFGGYWEERGDSDPINRFKTGFSKHIDKVTRDYLYIFKPLRLQVVQALKWLTPGLPAKSGGIRSTPSSNRACSMSWN